MSTSVADLTQRGRILLKRTRFFVFEVVRRGARRALRSLYPEPGTACVENKLVRLLFATEVDCREDLDVEKVGQVFF